MVNKKTKHVFKISEELCATTLVVRRNAYINLCKELENPDTIKQINIDNRKTVEDISLWAKLIERTLVFLKNETKKFRQRGKYDKSVDEEIGFLLNRLITFSYVEPKCFNSGCLWRGNFVFFLFEHVIKNLEDLLPSDKTIKICSGYIDSLINVLQSERYVLSFLPQEFCKRIIKILSEQMDAAKTTGKLIFQKLAVILKVLLKSSCYSLGGKSYETTILLLVANWFENNDTSLNVAKQPIFYDTNITLLETICEYVSANGYEKICFYRTYFDDIVLFCSRSSGGRGVSSSLTFLRKLLEASVSVTELFSVIDSIVLHVEDFQLLNPVAIFNSLLTWKIERHNNNKNYISFIDCLVSYFLVLWKMKNPVAEEFYQKIVAVYTRKKVPTEVFENHFLDKNFVVQFLFFLLKSDSILLAYFLKQRISPCEMIIQQSKISLDNFVCSRDHLNKVSVRPTYNSLPQNALYWAFYLLRIVSKKIYELTVLAKIKELKSKLNEIALSLMENVWTKVVNTYRITVSVLEEGNEKDNPYSLPIILESTKVLAGLVVLKLISDKTIEKIMKKVVDILLDISDNIEKVNNNTGVIDFLSLLSLLLFRGQLKYIGDSITIRNSLGKLVFKLISFNQIEPEVLSSVLVPCLLALYFPHSRPAVYIAENKLFFHTVKPEGTVLEAYSPLDKNYESDEKVLDLLNNIFISCSKVLKENIHASYEPIVLLLFCISRTVVDSKESRAVSFLEKFLTNYSKNICKAIMLCFTHCAYKFNFEMIFLTFTNFQKLGMPKFFSNADVKQMRKELGKRLEHTDLSSTKQSVEEKLNDSFETSFETLTNTPDSIQQVRNVLINQNRHALVENYFTISNANLEQNIMLNLNILSICFCSSYKDLALELQKCLLQPVLKSSILFRILFLKTAVFVFNSLTKDVVFSEVKFLTLFVDEVMSLWQAATKSIFLIKPVISLIHMLIELFLDIDDFPDKYVHKLATLLVTSIFWKTKSGRPTCLRQKSKFAFSSINMTTVFFPQSIREDLIQVLVDTCSRDKAFNQRCAKFLLCCLKDISLRIRLRIAKSYNSLNDSDLLTDEFIVQQIFAKSSIDLLSISEDNLEIIENYDSYSMMYNLHVDMLICSQVVSSFATHVTKLRETGESIFSLYFLYMKHISCQKDDYQIIKYCDEINGEHLKQFHIANGNLLFEKLAESFGFFSTDTFLIAYKYSFSTVFKEGVIQSVGLSLAYEKLFECYQNTAYHCLPALNLKSTTQQILSELYKGSESINLLLTDSGTRLNQLSSYIVYFLSHSDSSLFQNLAPGDLIEFFKNKKEILFSTLELIRKGVYSKYKFSEISKTFQNYQKFLGLKPVQILAKVISKNNAFSLFGYINIFLGRNYKEILALLLELLNNILTTGTQNIHALLVYILCNITKCPSIYIEQFCLMIFKTAKILLRIENNSTKKLLATMAPIILSVMYELKLTSGVFLSTWKIWLQVAKNFLPKCWSLFDSLQRAVVLTPHQLYYFVEIPIILWLNFGSAMDIRLAYITYGSISKVMLGFYLKILEIAIKVDYEVHCLFPKCSKLIACLLQISQFKLEKDLLAKVVSLSTLFYFRFYNKSSILDCSVELLGTEEYEYLGLKNSKYKSEHSYLNKVLQYLSIRIIVSQQSLGVVELHDFLLIESTENSLSCIWNNVNIEVLSKWQTLSTNNIEKMWQLNPDFHSWITQIFKFLSKASSETLLFETFESVFSELPQTLRKDILIFLLVKMALNNNQTKILTIGSNIVFPTLEEDLKYRQHGVFLLDVLMYYRKQKISLWRKLGVEEKRLGAKTFAKLDIDVDFKLICEVGTMLSHPITTILNIELDWMSESSTPEQLCPRKRAHSTSVADEVKFFQVQSPIKTLLLQGLRNLESDDVQGIIPGITKDAQFDNFCFKKDYFSALTVWSANEQDLTIPPRIMTEALYQTTGVIQLTRSIENLEISTFSKQFSSDIDSTRVELAPLLQNESFNQTESVLLKSFLKLVAEPFISNTAFNIKSHLNFISKLIRDGQFSPKISLDISVFLSKLGGSVEPSSKSNIITNGIVLVDKLIKSKNLNEARLSLDFLLEDTETYSSSVLEKKILSAKVRCSQAHYFWELGEKTTAIYIANEVIKMLEATKESSFIKNNLLASVLCDTGVWQDELANLDWQKIEEKYFSKSIDLLQNKGSADSNNVLKTTYLSMARYYDGMLLGMQEKLKSTLWKERQQNLAKIESQIKRFQQFESQNLSNLSAKKKVQKRKRNLDRQLVNDTDALSQAHLNYDHFLLESIIYYSKALRYGSQYKNDLKLTFRLCSLWFGHNKNEDLNSHISDIFSSKGEEPMPFNKFLSLLPQLASRVSEQKENISNFETIVISLLTEVAFRFPYHSLINLLPFVVDIDPDDPLLSSGYRYKKFKNIIDSFVNKNKKVDLLLPLRVSTTKKAFKAFHLLAKEKVSSKKTNSLKIESFKEFSNTMKALEMKNVLMPTSKIKLLWKNEKASITESFVCVANKPYGSSYIQISTSGRSKPKIMLLNGDNGKHFKLLIKGGDDLRQDFIMEQLFGLVNELLKTNVASHKRLLQIRTYEVLPLSDTTGIIEWVRKTVSFGEYLHGPLNGSFENSAHYRHNVEKDAFSFLDAWKALTKIASENRKRRSDITRKELDASGTKKQVMVYKKICSKFLPVFRHFFYENFTDPISWYKQKQRYTRSVATNSVIGYIMGIGDRHTQNMLIDQQTAEIIHIDFGYVFEQSKLLSIPEQVPFRLTPDVIDGFGITKAKGSFQVASEIALNVLRENLEVLQTICEVFIYDPLYDWRITPEKIVQSKKIDLFSQNSDFNIQTVSVNEMQQTTDEDSSLEAKRALNRINQKLRGLENPSGEVFDVPNQVRHLIREATNEESLSKMFAGWAPFV